MFSSDGLFVLIKIYIAFFLFFKQFIIKMNDNISIQRNIIINFFGRNQKGQFCEGTYLNFGYIIKHISRRGATKNWEHFASNLQVSPFCIIVYGTCKYTNWTLANKLTWRQCQARGFFSELKVSRSRNKIVEL